MEGTEQKKKKKIKQEDEGGGSGGSGGKKKGKEKSKDNEDTDGSKRKKKTTSTEERSAKMNKPVEEEEEPVQRTSKFMRYIACFCLCPIKDRKLLRAAKLAREAVEPEEDESDVIVDEKDVEDIRKNKN